MSTTRCSGASAERWRRDGIPALTYVHSLNCSARVSSYALRCQDPEAGQQGTWYRRGLEAEVWRRQILCGGWGWIPKGRAEERRGLRSTNTTLGPESGSDYEILLTLSTPLVLQHYLRLLSSVAPTACLSLSTHDLTNLSNQKTSLPETV